MEKHGQRLFSRASLFFHLFADAQQQVQQDAKNGRPGDAGHLEAEEGDIPAKGVLAANADHHDGGNDGNVLRGEHIHFFLDHNGDALGSDGAEQVDLQAADHSQGDAVDHLDEGREEADDHRHNRGHHQHRHGEHLGNGHGADILAIVGAGRAAHHTGDHVADAVADEVAVQQVDQVVLLLAAFALGHVVDVDIQLVHMGSGLGDGGNGNGHDSRHSRPGNLGEGEGGHRKNGAVTQLPQRGVQRCGRHSPEQVGHTGRIEDTGHNAAGEHTQQQGKLSQKAFQIPGVYNGGQQGDQGHHSPGHRFSAHFRRSRDGVTQGVAGQGQADDHGHWPGDGSGQDGFHHFLAKELHQQAGGNGHQARADDAELGILDGLGGQDAVHLLEALRGAHTGNGRQVGKAGAIVQRDLLTGDQDEAQGGKAAGENGGGYLEACHQRHRDCGGEHDDHLLDGVQQQLDEPRAFLR